MMPTEILFYTPVYSYNAADMIRQLEDNKNSDIVMRVNTPGGEVYYAYGIIIKFAEHKKKKTIIVDGIAASAGAIFCCYADNVEAYDISTFLFHRAAYYEYYEKDTAENAGRRKELIKINKDLRAAMESKFTAEKWEEVTGVSLDDLFSLDYRIDVTLDAAQALKLGLVNKIHQVTPEKASEISAIRNKAMAAHHQKVEAMSTQMKPAADIIREPIDKSKLNSPKKMTAQEFQAQHPAAYNEIYNAGMKAGATAELDRVESILTFAHLDLEACKKAVTDGKPLTQKQLSEFSLKAMSTQRAGEISADNPQQVATTEQGDKNKDTVNAFENTVRGMMGLGAQK